MEHENSDNDEQAEHRPTYAGYSEPRLKALLKSLDPEDPADRSIKADIERRLRVFSGRE